MAFEWKLIGEDAQPSGSNPSEQPVSAQNPQSAESAAAPEVKQQDTAHKTEGYQPTPEAVPGLPRCDAHNSTVNSTEKIGYNGAYDAEVYSSYDTGVNSEENSIVA